MSNKDCILNYGLRGLARIMCMNYGLRGLARMVCVVCVLGCLTVVCGCQQVDLNDIEESRVETVTFQVDEPTYTLEPFSARRKVETRGTMSDAGLTTLYVVVDGVLTKTHASTDKDFGSVSLSLTHGEHTVVFVSSAEAMTYSEGVFTPSGKVMDTFGKVVTLNVTSGMEAQNVELERMICRLAVVVTDGVPTDCAKVQITVAKHYGTVLGSTLFATGEGAEYVNTISIPSAYRGVANLALNTNSFCTSADEWQTDVTIDFLDASDNVLQTRTKANVPLQQNCITNLTGAYATAANANVTLTADWGNAKSAEF